ncbi:hypothetical protein [Kordiimonas sp.]|uniref:hypothetical protein n=1 Tax=Kordiimonas sp. TaxID=1970157 RepID=UPI003A94F630
MEDGQIFVLTIIFGSFVFAGFSQWMKAKTDAMKNAAREGDNALKREVRALEERVRVLERIATDKRSRLKEEIDAL